MTTVKITKIGNSVGIVLPKEVLERLRVGQGDQLHITEAPDGVTLTPYDAELQRQMETAEQVMRERRNVLRKLAE
ncbi:MAG: AbrB/MazE/SpoVT family DNA-binding domain-containing protein [Planctomycetota bacterium]